MRNYSIIDTYTESQLRQIVASSNSMKEVLLKLGYSATGGNNHVTVRKRLELYDISTDHFFYQAPVIRTMENVFCNESTATQKVLRDWFKKISDDSYCQICGQSKLWNGKSLTMILDHINCNSQLLTFAGRNSSKTKYYNKPFIIW